MVGRPVAERVTACVGALLVGTTALAAFAAPAQAANDPDQFAVVAVDARTSPAFSLDVHVPQRERLNTYSTSQFTLSGGTDLSVSRVNSEALDVVLVLDDRATTSGAALALLKSAAVELVRDLDDGTRLAVETISSAGAITSTPVSTSRSTTSSSTAPSSSPSSSPSFSTDKRQITNAIAAAGAGQTGSSVALGGASVGLRLAGIASRAVATAERRTRLVAFVQPDATFTAVDRSVLEQVHSRTRTTMSALVIGAPAGTAIDAGGSTAVTVVDDGPNNLVASVDRLAGTLTSLYQVSFRAVSPSVVLALQAVAETYRTTIDVGLPERADPQSAGAPAVTPAVGSSPDTDVGTGSSTPAATTDGAPAAAAPQRRVDPPVRTLAVIALVGSLLGAAGAIVVFGLHRRRRVARPRPPETLRFGRLVLDERSGEARAGRRAVALDEREAAALGALMRRPGRILWVDADGAFGGAGPRPDVGVAGHLGTRTLTALGEKLDDLGEGELLHVVPGGGYLADDDLDDRFDPLDDDDGDDSRAEPTGARGARDRGARLEPGSRNGGSGRRAAS